MQLIVDGLQRQQADVLSEYELLEVFDQPQDTARRPAVPGTPPTPTAKPRASASREPVTP